MREAYPAIVHKDDDTYWVEFPDIEGCFSDGETLADALSNAVDALGSHLCTMMDYGIEIPAPSDAKSIAADDGVVSIIVTDPLNYKKKTRAVKKTLTIPEWLNEEAEKRHINFSSALQKALIAMIQ